MKTLITLTFFLGTLNLFSQTVEQREEFFRLLNEERAKHGLDSITYEPLADSAADYRLNSICSCLDTLSDELYEEDYRRYMHYKMSEDIDSINRYIFPRNISPGLWGECVYRAGILDYRPPLYPKLLINAFYGWMDSYSHREVMMNNQLRFGGIKWKRCKSKTILYLVLYQKKKLTESEIREAIQRRINIEKNGL